MSSECFRINCPGSKGKELAASYCGSQIPTKEVELEVDFPGLHGLCGGRMQTKLKDDDSYKNGYGYYLL